MFLLFDGLVYSNIFDMKMALMGMHNMKHMGWARDKIINLFNTFQNLAIIMWNLFMWH
jgi:hypothetical protein